MKYVECLNVQTKITHYQPVFCRIINFRSGFMQFSLFMPVIGDSKAGRF